MKIKTVSYSPISNRQDLRLQVLYAEVIQKVTF